MCKELLDLRIAYVVRGVGQGEHSNYSDGGKGNAKQKIREVKVQDRTDYKH